MTPQQTPREFELSPDSESDRQLVWDDLLSIDEISSVLQQLPLDAPAWDKTENSSLRRELVALCRQVQSRKVAFLLENNFRLAAEIGADGVHLSLPMSADLAIVDDARNVIGQSAILGLTVDGTKHHAMIAGEMGVDYLSFNKDDKNHNGCFELLSWWSELFEIPSVAWNLEHSQDVQLALSAGAEFIALPDPFCTRPHQEKFDLGAIAQLLRDQFQEQNG